MNCFSFVFAVESCPSSICVFCVHPAPPLLVFKSLSLPAADKASKSAVLGGLDTATREVRRQLWVDAPIDLQPVAPPGGRALARIALPPSNLFELNGLLLFWSRARTRARPNKHKTTNAVLMFVLGFVCKSLRQTKQTPLYII